MIKTRNGIASIFVALLLLPVSYAHAVLIDGSISMSGGFTPVDTNGDEATLGAATGIDFDDFGPGGNATVDQATGDFTGLTVATMTDFQFFPALDPDPVDVWVSGDFTFTMESVTIRLQEDDFLLLQGTGFISANGFDNTFSEWRLSGQTVDNLTWSWSSSNNTVIPVPAAVWLFGSGLIGLVAVARRRQAA